MDDVKKPETTDGPSLSYVALIATVLLASPEQKLNLLSIYRALEQRFPHLRARGPGWRNSVRHNLSVNSCFVKVGRCEDGRGHYWGVHQDHLGDFQSGNFRRFRKPRARRVTGGERVAPQRPLLEQMRDQRSPLVWTEEHPCPLWSYLRSVGGSGPVSWWQRPLAARTGDCFMTPPLLHLPCCVPPRPVMTSPDFTCRW